VQKSLRAVRRVAIDDLWGVFYVRKGPGVKWKSYYSTIDALRPILVQRQFTAAISGFYLNVHSSMTSKLDSLRISYFTSESDVPSAISVFKRFFEHSGFLEVKESTAPKQCVVAANYGGQEFEERFRNFLNLETRIGLELIKADLLQARCLLLTYRWQVRKAGLPLRAHFEPTFSRDSPTYNSISESEKDQLFDDLQEWPNPPQVDWAHFMVNLVLGCDWNYVFGDRNYLTPASPLSIQEINAKVMEQGFEVPLGWHP
jgi:hypothetical protein